MSVIGTLRTGEHGRGHPQRRPNKAMADPSHEVRNGGRVVHTTLDALHGSVRLACAVGFVTDRLKGFGFGRIVHFVRQV